MKFRNLTYLAVVALMATACGNQPAPETNEPAPAPAKLSDKYAQVTMTSDISHLSDNEKQMLPLLFEAADIMDEIFWMENWGDKNALMEQISDPDIKLYAEINYGPWDGLNNEASFVEGIGEKPAGAQFYPQDMTMEEWEAFDDPSKTSQYTMIVRDENGALK